MKELFRTNDAVRLSWAQAILASEGIQAVVFDANMASVEGSLGALPRRLMVPEDDFIRAERILKEAEPGQDVPTDCDA